MATHHKDDFKPSRRSLLKGASGLAMAATGLVGFPSVLRAQTKEMIIGCAAGHVGWMNKTVVPLFEKKYGCKLTLEGTKSSVNLEKMRQNKDKPYLSAVMMDDPVLIQAVGEGVIEKLTPSGVPNLSALKPGTVHMDGMWANYQQPWCGIGFNTAGTKKVESWNELWDKKLQRRVIIPSLQNTEGVWTLFFAAALATGKPLADAQYDIDAAFEKLKALKPNLLTVYTQMPASFNLLEQGEAAMLAGAFSEFAIPRKNKGAPVDLAAPKEGVGAMPSGIARVKGGPQQELAFAFLNEMLGPDFQAAMIKETYALPTSTKAPPSDVVPAGVPVFVPDWANVAKNRQAWIERFDREIAA